MISKQFNSKLGEKNGSNLSRGFLPHTIILPASRLDRIHHPWSIRQYLMSRRIPPKGASTAVAPPFANQAASASSSPSSQRQPAAWWARRIFRLGSLVFALIWVFPKLYTTWDLTKSEKLSAEDHQAPYVWRSEEIEVDLERRAAVLQAFRVC